VAELQTPRTAAEISRAELEARDTGAVVVEIYDQIYQLRGTDPAYIERLANVVDGKMRAVASHGATVDSLRVAVLASLNIADELVTLRARFDSLQASVAAAEAQRIVQPAFHSRANSLMGMLDDVLLDRKAS
jgi:cell division protein ZapA